MASDRPGRAAGTATARGRCRRAALALLALLAAGTPAAAEVEALPEYKVKAGFMYNFALFTEWPAATTGGTLTLCLHGGDPFGAEIDRLAGKPVGARQLTVRRVARIDALLDCQIVFVAAAALGALPQVGEALRGRAVLIIADGPTAAGQSAALNLAVVRERVVFDADLVAAQAGRVTLSARLLRLAREVRQ